MRFREIIAEAPVYDMTLPAKATALLDKPRQVRLKHGEIATLVMSLKTGEVKGITIEGTIDGVAAGRLNLSPNGIPPAPDSADEYDAYVEDRGSWSATDVWVDPGYTRRGLATAMYDFATRAGFKILPSGIHGGRLKPDGQELWYSNRVPMRLGKPLPKQSRFWKVRKV